jgi:PAS domain S-box-containing protein
MRLAAEEAEGLTRLQELSTRLLTATDLQSLLEEVLTATIALQGADFGNLQLYKPDTQTLEIIAHRGFQQDFLNYFGRVHEGSAAGGRALQRWERVIIEDVQTDPDYEPHRQIAAAAGFRAVQSIPLFSRSGELLGMISTHFREPHRPSEIELRLTDLYARQAAEVVESKRMEQSLRESEERFRSLVDGIKDCAIFMLDPDGRVITWNDGAERIKGYRAQEILGQHFSCLYEQDDIQSGKPAQALIVAAATGRCEDEGWRRRKDGSRFWANVIITALEDETGKLKGFAKLTRDMTERKRAEETLRNVQVELTHAARVMTMGELTASIAHEINQPLTAIVSNAQACARLLASAAPDLDEARAATADIVEAGTRASAVIAQMRALLQKTIPTKTRLDFNTVIEEMIGFTRSELNAHRVLVQLDLLAGLPPVLGDRVQLQQVLLNLMMNGIEAMATVTNWPRILLIRSQVHDSHSVLVAMQDSGVGLNLQDMDRLFSTFFTTKSGGMGMGLAISRSIIETHGGRLWAVAHPGSGATFCFTLPAFRTEAP